MSQEFNWHNEEEDEDSSIVVKTVLAIAVYQNKYGDVVIRQQAAYHGGEDNVIAFPKEYTQSLVNAIIENAVDG